MQKLINNLAIWNESRKYLLEKFKHQNISLKKHRFNSLKLSYLYSSMICTENNSSSHQIQKINVNKAFSGCILAFSKDKGQIWIDVLEKYRPIGHNTALAVNYFFGGFGQHMDDFCTGTGEWPNGNLKY